MRSLLSFLAVSCLCILSVQAETYFAQNVSLDSGWVNTKKLWDGSDYNLCWAATASNLLQWWQNNSSGIPASIPNGLGENGRTEIYNTFISNWKNTTGSAASAMEWYMGGYTLNSNIYQNDFKTGEAEARQSGRYWEEHVKLMGFSTDIINYPCPYITGQSINGLEDVQGLGKLFPSYFDRGGCIALTYQEGTQYNGHVISCWGVEINEETGMIEFVYVTDSDNDKGLEKRAVVYNETDNRLHLGSENSNNWINAYDALILPFYNVPEPSSCSMVLVFAGFALLRRRRSL